MLKIYGTMLCKDCVDCCADLDRAGVAYTFLDFAAELRNLKEFLHLRDTLALFDKIKENGSIGIPCIVDEQGTVSLDWRPYCNM